MEWIKLTEKKPKDLETVYTKVDDGNGVRNEKCLKKCGNEWIDSQSGRYVYYTPTHWIPLSKITF